MKGMVGIGENRMEEGEISTITQLRQIVRRGRTETPVRCAIKNCLEPAPIYCENAAPPAGGGIQKPGYNGGSDRRRSLGKGCKI